MPLIEYKLRPWQEIEPWGTSPDLRLSWFGFSDGFYRICAGSAHLLEYSSTLVDHSAQEADQLNRTSWVDYQVVRLWEDLHEILYDVMQPIPEPLPTFLTLGYAEQEAWAKKAFEWAGASGNGSRDDTYEAATSWIYHRRLNAGYLSPEARIWMWSDERAVTIAWDNRELSYKGVPAWAAERGTWTLPREAFVAEMQSFNDRFVGEMGQRVGEICTSWHRVDVHVDLSQLKSEHADRAGWWNKVLKRPPTIYSWDDVRRAMATIDNDS